MFALVFYDTRINKLFLIRDRFDIKPLHYFTNGNQLIFASQIKAILASEVLQKEIDFSAYADYSVYRYIPYPKTIWKNISKLTPAFSEWIKLKVDLENALSVFSVIQKQDKGGELFLYDLEWENFNYKLNDSTYEERHTIDGQFFSSRGIKDPERKSIELNNGDTVIFRAAQIWHAINKIEGDKVRITLGCFIAQGYDKNLYYWS